MEQGTLFVKLESAREALPVQGRVVISQTVNGVRVLEIELVTDEDGLTQPVTLDAPDRSISLDPASTQQAWAAYDVEAYADGYSDILLEGVQVYSGVEAYAPISMLPIFSSQAVSPTAVTADTGSTSRKAQQDILHTTIPAPAIRGGSASGPAPLSTCATQPLVLQSVFIPQYITVHLGKPQNSAANETVSFPYYIKNVCSSEIYPTWPENAIRANIYAQISLALNRVYTEWYPSKGYNFNITNSTQYDQYYVSGRNIFTNISRIVDDIFNTYLRRVGDFAPYYAEYCNGTTVTCKGMSQWGTVSLAESGLSPIQILRRYYAGCVERVKGQADECVVRKLELVMQQAGVTPDICPAVAASLEKAEATGKPAGAMVLPDGSVVTGRTSPLLGASAALLLNALKKMAGIDHKLDLIPPSVIEPISAMKTGCLGHRNPRLHSDEVLIALAISGLTNPLAAMVQAQLKNLRGCEAHFSVIISEEDAKLYKRLGINVSCEAKYEVKSLYHK